MFGPFGRFKGTLEFKNRSSERDANTDLARVSRVAEVLGAELSSTEKERDGLFRRLNDLSARAAISQGNDIDEYLTRDEEDIRHLNLFDAQMRVAERRLEKLDQNIAHFRFLSDQLSRRFPGVQPDDDSNG